ncbi:MAG: hypothetical protein ACQEVA_19060 [Myxococcota bacterium]
MIDQKGRDVAPTIDAGWIQLIASARHLNVRRDERRDALSALALETQWLNGSN